MHVLHVVGARPNFMKADPVIRALASRDGTRQTLVDTGQHYDANMSDVFFRELDMPQPDVSLRVGSGSQAQQTGEVMVRFEPVVSERKPDLVLVYGDVNSTLAAALVCVKLLVPVGHVEAGLRSFDRSMPEETNRVLTDQMADLLFTPSADADDNLLSEGVTLERVHLVGNVMIDTLVRRLPESSDRWRGETLRPWSGKRYGLVTLHRPSNVDDPATLGAIIDTLASISRDLPLVFPVHPRTRERLHEFDLQPVNSNLRLIEPLSYLDFLALQRQATLVITDSGGVQEETTFLGVPCLTLRDHTERPVTVNLGTNTVVGQVPERLCSEVRRVLSGGYKTGEVPPLWDGHAADRIADVIESWG